MNNSSHESELLLVAFRYHMAEMSPSEVAAFEQQLADDQATREALADIVQLRAALGSGPVPATADVLPRSRPVSVRSVAARTVFRWPAATATVTALALLVAWTTLRPAPEHSLSVGQFPSEAALWASLAPNAEMHLAASDLDDSTASTEFFGGQMAVLEVPDWMLSAVEASSATERGHPADDDEETL